MSNLIGKYLDRYHILEQLGEGGMATVYKAFDTRLERDVAIKVIRTELFGKAVIERILKRFEREAKALARLSHPNIVKVHDYGEYEDAPYLVLEYLPGGTLKDKLKGTPMDWEVAFRLLLPVVRALSVAHREKIIHRDLKPSNILLTDGGEPLLTDFGIAKILELDDGQTLTGTGVGVGTPEYMAPEQGLGKDVDARADIYALGVVLYEMITGRKPYTADTPMAVVFKHVSDPLPRPTEYVPKLALQAEKVLLKTLAKEPKNRYQNMQELAQAIEIALRGKGGAKIKADEEDAQSVDTQKTVLVESGVDAELTVDDFETDPEQTAWVAPQKEKADKPDYGIVRQPKIAPPPPRKAQERRTDYLPWVVGAALVFIGGLIWLDSSSSRSATPTMTPALQATITLTQPAASSLGIGSFIIRHSDEMKMLYIPAGEFEMGSEDGGSDEKPIHTVYLDAFWMDE
ncbi:MAG: protein kinase, partial [Anaerolineae bacterium]|nr:protein kinase [Anaerolineae bacterium]